MTSTKGMRSVASAAVVALTLLCLCPLPGAAEQVTFRWAFLKPGTDEQTREVIDLRVTPRVTEGDRLQIYVATDTPVFLYLFLFDSSKSLHLLFPPRVELYTKQALPPGTYFIPGEDEWFVMDAVKGSEDFHLLVADQRLKKIEGLARRYLKDTADQQAKADVLTEIAATRSAYSKIAGPVEKGVPIAGTVRGLHPGVTILGQATSVEKTTFYGRVLRLSHE